MTTVSHFPKEERIDNQIRNRSDVLPVTQLINWQLNKSITILIYCIKQHAQNITHWEKNMHDKTTINMDHSYNIKYIIYTSTLCHRFTHGNPPIQETCVLWLHTFCFIFLYILIYYCPNINPFKLLGISPLYFSNRYSCLTILYI